jgi:hypothetical protein
MTGKILLAIFIIASAIVTILMVYDRLKPNARPIPRRFHPMRVIELNFGRAGLWVYGAILVVGWSYALYLVSLTPE